MLDLLPAGSTVDHSGFVQFPVDAHQGGIVENTVISQAFPNVHQDQNNRPVLGRGIPGNDVFSKRLQDAVVDKAIFSVQKGVNQITDNDDRDQEGN